MTVISEIQCARLYIYIEQIKMRKVFIFKNPDTFQKAKSFLLHFIYKKLETLRYLIFHESSGVCIFLQKV